MTTTEISSDSFARRCQILSPFPPISAIPNQLHSTLSSSSSQCYSDSDEEALQEKGIRSNLELEDYMNDSALSVDGEFDVRVDIISMSMRPLTASTSSSPLVFATAPPLSDYESDDAHQKKSTTTTTTTTTTITTTPPHKADASKQETYKETCIICYEDIADISGVVVREESEISVSDFCRTCKYTVHLDCIDEYRVNKLNDAVAERDGASISSSSVGIKCLMCSLEVERIYVRRNGDIDIIKHQIARNNEDRFNPRERDQQRLSPEQRLQRDLHAQVLNNMERRMRRERRNRFRQKCCNFCFFTILAMSIAVIVIMRFA